MACSDPSQDRVFIIGNWLLPIKMVIIIKHTQTFFVVPAVHMKITPAMILLRNEGILWMDHVKTRDQMSEQPEIELW